MVFRHVILSYGYVHHACLKKGHSKTKTSVLCCLGFKEKITQVEKKPFLIYPLLANGSTKMGFLWMVFRRAAIFLRKRHELKSNYFYIGCLLPADGSYRIKIRVLWMLFRHLISDVRCACFEKKAKQNKNLDCVLFVFFRKQHTLKRNHFDIESSQLTKGSYKIKIRVLWIVFRHLISVVRVLKKSTAKQKISILCCLRFLESSTSLKEAILI